MSVCVFACVFVFLYLNYATCSEVPSGLICIQVDKEKEKVKKTASSSAASAKQAQATLAALDFPIIHKFTLNAEQVRENQRGSKIGKGKRERRREPGYPRTAQYSYGLILMFFLQSHMLMRNPCSHRCTAA